MYVMKNVIYLKHSSTVLKTQHSATETGRFQEQSINQRCNHPELSAKSKKNNMVKNKLLIYMDDDDDGPRFMTLMIKKITKSVRRDRNLHVSEHKTTCN